MLILQTAEVAARRSCSSGMPTASSSLPPYLLIISTYFGHDRRGAVQHDREARDALLDLLEDVEAERRRHEHAVGVARALRGLELVGAVRGADRDGQRVDAGAP